MSTRARQRTGSLICRPKLRPVLGSSSLALYSSSPCVTLGMSLTPYVIHAILSFMAWEVEFTNEFGGWWDGLTEEEQESVDFCVSLLQKVGPMLTRPYADAVHGSEFPNMRELRVQHDGRPYRILYAFDPRRTGILLIGGDKTGNARWYEEYVPKADALFAQHLREINEK